MFDWRGFLALADELSGRDDEASLRSAVSRAYYSAFCSARNWLQEDGAAVPKTSQAHRREWNEFEGHSDVERRRVGQLGNRLRHSRNKADYDNTVNRLEDVALNALVDAEAILEFLKPDQASS